MVKKQHPLTEPRVVAAVGLIALGGGMGVGLMLARTLIIVGFLLALVCAAGVVWLYYEYLTKAYNALKGRGKYKGPRVLELLIALGMSIVLTAVACAVFPIVLTEAPSPNRARLELSGFTRITYPTEAEPSVNVRIGNAGNLSAERTTILLTGRLETKTIEKKSIDKDFEGMVSAINTFDKKGTFSHGQINPSTGAIITLEDIKPGEWLRAADGKTLVQNTVKFSDGQWSAFEKGLLNLYILYVAHYEDEGSPGGYWEAKFCGYYTVTIAYWHNCAANEIHRIARSRN